MHRYLKTIFQNELKEQKKQFKYIQAITINKTNF